MHPYLLYINDGCQECLSQLLFEFVFETFSAAKLSTKERKNMGKKGKQTFYLEGWLRIGSIVKRLQPVLQKKLNQ